MVTEQNLEGQGTSEGPGYQHLCNTLLQNNIQIKVSLFGKLHNFCQVGLRSVPLDLSLYYIMEVPLALFLEKLFERNKDTFCD